MGSVGCFGQIENIKRQSLTIVDDGQEKDKEYNDCISAFEDALKDIDNGTLPFGGGSGRGHGIFKCEIKKNGEKL